MPSKTNSRILKSIVDAPWKPIKTVQHRRKIVFLLSATQSFFCSFLDIIGTHGTAKTSYKPKRGVA